MTTTAPAATIIIEPNLIISIIFACHFEFWMYFHYSNTPPPNCPASPAIAASISL